MRKIVHIDMDAFYASVEQRDNPELRGKPVIVAWKGNRSVVCAASYEARKFGVRSAMPALRAERLCPDGIFIAPDFPRYRAVSRLTREIFKRHTDLVEPLSLDEAYLDVTENKTGLPTATRVASTIREQIRQELQLTASAGVAPNKFLAKLASDWRKPDGLFVIQPEEVESFLSPLSVNRLPGVGKVTVQDLRSWESRRFEKCETWTLRCSNENSADLACVYMSYLAALTKTRLFRTDPRNPFLLRIRSSVICCCLKPSL
jgi:DNA polymerase IV